LSRPNPIRVAVPIEEEEEEVFFQITSLNAGIFDSV